MTELASEELRLVLTTVPDISVGEYVVRELIEERLIACANLLPSVTSMFRWDAEIKQEMEILVLMKTSHSNVPRLYARVSELHPYKVPELLTLSVESASNAYRRWVLSETNEVGA